MTMFACPECERPFAGGRCECRRDWTETGGVPDLYVAAADRGELLGITGDIRTFYEDNPGPPWRPDDDDKSVARSGSADPLLASLDAELAPRARLLDLGCGGGAAACFLGLQGREVIGVDVAMTGLLRGEAFRRRLGLGSVSFVRGNLFRPPATPGSVDAVVLFHVLETTGAELPALKAAARALRTGGRLALRVATPYSTPPTPAPPQHHASPPSELHRWLAEAGFILETPHSGRIVQELRELRWKWFGAGPAEVALLARKG
ncbi:hypothetical protein LBMAG42_24420 [Deltaproteobacteria bacterium]|nr:hypothetical protein LBMAG42_24420 [Deltaproteobacteria bacterium]